MHTPKHFCSLCPYKLFLNAQRASLLIPPQWKWLNQVTCSQKLAQRPNSQFFFLSPRTQHCSFGDVPRGFTSGTWPSWPRRIPFPIQKWNQTDASLPWHVGEPSPSWPDLLRRGNLEAHEMCTQVFLCNVKALLWFLEIYSWNSIIDYKTLLGKEFQAAGEFIWKASMFF